MKKYPDSTWLHWRPIMWLRQWHCPVSIEHLKTVNDTKYIRIMSIKLYVIYLKTARSLNPHKVNNTDWLSVAPPTSQSHPLQPMASWLRAQCSGCRRIKTPIWHLIFRLLATGTIQNTVTEQWHGMLMEHRDTLIPCRANKLPFPNTVLKHSKELPWNISIKWCDITLILKAFIAGLISGCSSSFHSILSRV